MNGHDVINSNQHYFRENHDTNNSIREVIDIVNNSFDNNFKSLGCF